MEYQIVDEEGTNISSMMAAAAAGVNHHHHHPDPLIRIHDPLETFNASDFVPKPYGPSRNIIHQHVFPRFGHTNNFGALVSGLMDNPSSSQGAGGRDPPAKDYIVGVIAGAMFILGVSLVWSMVVVALKIAGQKRVGFLAGRLEHPDATPSTSTAPDADAPNEDSGTLPSIPEDESVHNTHDEVESNSSEEIGTSTSTTPLILSLSNSIIGDAERMKRDKKFIRKIRAVRAVFATSGLCVIVASILYHTKGIDMFRQSLESAHGGLDLVQQTAYQAIKLTEDVKNDKNELLTDFNKTKTATAGHFCNGDGTHAQAIREHFDTLLTEIHDLNDMVDANVDNFQHDLTKVITMAQDVDESLYSADVFFYVALVITVVVQVLIVSMLVVMIFSARGVTNCCTRFATHAILWPVFVFMLVLFWMFALLFLVASLAGSDFCVEPDQVVEWILVQKEDLFHSVIFQFIVYYVSGCTVVPSSHSEIAQVSNQIKEIVSAVHDLSATVMEVPIPQLQAQCGLDKAAATAFQGGAELLHATAHAINNAWIDVRYMLECKTFNPIYTTFVHDAVCVEGVNGLTWIFSTSFAIFSFAMIMIMFRAALYPVNHPTTK